MSLATCAFSVIISIGALQTLLQKMTTVPSYRTLLCQQQLTNFSILKCLSRRRIVWYIRIYQKLVISIKKVQGQCSRYNKFSFGHTTALTVILYQSRYIYLSYTFKEWLATNQNPLQLIHRIANCICGSKPCCCVGPLFRMT